MKPNIINQTNFQSLPTGNNWECLKDQTAETPFSFQEFTVPSNMTHQELQPPSHVWDKIVSVLDEQDKKKHLIQVQSKMEPVATPGAGALVILGASIAIVIATVIIFFVI